MELTVFRVGVFLSLIAPRFSNYGFSLLAPLTSPSIFDKKNCFIFLKFHFSELSKKQIKSSLPFMWANVLLYIFAIHAQNKNKIITSFFARNLLLLQKQAVHFIHRSSSVCLSVLFAFLLLFLLVLMLPTKTQWMVWADVLRKMCLGLRKKERAKEGKSERKKERKKERAKERARETQIEC